MDTINDTVRSILENTEFLAIVTHGADGPHVTGNWGHYLRRIGVNANRLVLPAGRYRQTEENLRGNNRVQVLVASRAVQGTRSPGQGCVLVGTGSIQTQGEAAERAKACFPWVRGALVIDVQSVKMQL